MVLQLVAKGGQLAPGHTDALLHELIAETGDFPAQQQLISGLVPILARAARSSEAFIQGVSWGMLYNQTAQKTSQLRSGALSEERP